ncbi:hypothetical protein CROQUDRAFT_96624 [Cronartium quercuum f. sp. fusiforme G11]|uniref:Uncharacterized protein n=1 Tax=Cronartium quercuum f. sp. fusiforme G11 TaxID=708437 RepID=A0A9P6NGJ4_9BASI|nr:hypothetical protein CROQUDRAFT_96624 [Cronartium quercuum f. sp. fusiforme G11]
MSIIWTPPPNNSAGPVNSKGSSELRSLPSSPGLLALLTLTVGSHELLISRAHQAEDLLHWALYGQYLIPTSMHDRAIHVPTWDPPSCRLVTRFYPHELVELHSHLEWASSETTQYRLGVHKEKQEKTSQAQPGGHVTKLRSHGTLISQLLPGHAEPVKACILLGNDLLSSRSGQEREDTILLVSFLNNHTSSVVLMSSNWRETFLHKREILMCMCLKPGLMQVFDTFRRLKPDFGSGLEA